MEPTVVYTIEMTTNTIRSFPRIFRIVSINGTEIHKQLVSFEEVQAVRPDLGVEYAELYKTYLEDFVTSVDTSLGFLGLAEVDLSDFASGINYAASVSAVPAHQPPVVTE
jgi:hypothetical protein